MLGPTGETLTWKDGSGRLVLFAQQKSSLAQVSLFADGYFSPQARPRVAVLQCAECPISVL